MTGAPLRESDGGSTKRVPVLDGLRGLAIALVLVNNNFPERLTAPRLDVIAVHLSRFGWIGVDLFFVLSGYLITGILFDTKGGPGYFRNFYARRVLRIFPLYYAVLFVVFVIVPHTHLATADQLRRLHQQRWYYWLYMANLGTMIHGNTAFNTGHFWSLAVEEQFYLIWPLVVLLFDRRRLIGVCLVVMAASFVLRAVWLFHGLSSTWVYEGTPFRVDGLAVGAMVALIMRRPGGAEWLARWAWPVGRVALPLGVALVAWFEMTHTTAGNFGVQVFGYPALAFGFGALLVRCLDARPESRLARTFDSRSMRFLGRYSYAVYVLHPFVLLFLNEMVPWTFTPPLVLGSHVPVGILVIPLVTLITLPLALLSWNLLEKRFLALKRYFPYSREVRQAPAAVQALPVAAATEPRSMRG
jgi:peptidoglycan/LPS O-acetylase OafA/YrhL